MTEEQLEALKGLLHYLNDRPVHQEVVVTSTIRTDDGKYLGTVSSQEGVYVFLFPSAADFGATA